MVPEIFELRTLPLGWDARTKTDLPEDPYPWTEAETHHRK